MCRTFDDLSIHLFQSRRARQANKSHPTQPFGPIGVIKRDIRWKGFDQERILRTQVEKRVYLIRDGLR